MKIHAQRLIAIAMLLLPVSGCGWFVREMMIGYIQVDSKLVPKHVSIELEKRFIEEYKNRVIVHTTFKVDKAMKDPLPPPVDGDLHIVGRAPQVELPIVAEIANAREEKAAVDAVHEAAEDNATLRISGVWRIWPEHAGRAIEEQGRPLSEFHSDNPSHVFEIHPVTSVGRISTLDSFHPVKGFEPGDVEQTFAIFQKATCTLKIMPARVAIVADTGLYNDVEFVMKPVAEPQLIVPDGRFVVASVLDHKGKVLVDRVRMVFTRGTPPELAMRRLRGNEELHVYGIPRIDFAEIARRMEGLQPGTTTPPEPLPYEILILGVYPK